MTKMFLAAAAALAMLASCSKNADEIADTAKGGVVKITLTDKTPAMTRAFFGTTAAAESWEKKINSLTLFVFDGSDRAVLQRRFSAAEISGQAATIPVPEAKPGELYKFYVVANSDNPEKVADLTELRSTTESEAASYNGTFDEVTTKAVRSGGFTMTGSATKAIAQAGQTTDVQIGIERLVAKIAVQTATDSTSPKIIIQEHFADPITIEELARLSHLSKSYFMSCFKQTFGLGAVEYLTQFRIKAACEALRSTTQSVSEIAYDNGFRNLSNFNRQFRSKVGCTPSDRPAASADK